jgi:hypothetical protein
MIPEREEKETPEEDASCVLSILRTIRTAHLTLKATMGSK